VAFPGRSRSRAAASTDQTFATWKDISMETLTARMPNPAVIIPEAMKPIQALFGSISGGGVPRATLDLVHLRVSQVNGCSPCVDGGWRTARKAGETDERIFAVAAWRETPARKDCLRLAYGSGRGGRKS
jgi:AhpD family alkylhydroperoxidase